MINESFNLQKIPRDLNFRIGLKTFNSFQLSF